MVQPARKGGDRKKINSGPQPPNHYRFNTSSSVTPLSSNLLCRSRYNNNNNKNIQAKIAYVHTLSYVSLCRGLLHHLFSPTGPWSLHSLTDILGLTDQVVIYDGAVAARMRQHRLFEGQSFRRELVYGGPQVRVPNLLLLVQPPQLILDHLVLGAALGCRIAIALLLRSRGQRLVRHRGLIAGEIILIARVIRRVLIP
ncbi:hypothetical protein BX600DRAFT_142075 [Xylariales sp. PMI_506]|nr:hypothetical protein BX600DRAFT_142075 [Xylariales sp. PMI_506]